LKDAPMEATGSALSTAVWWARMIGGYRRWIGL
jgi:hypothetical protein